MDSPKTLATLDAQGTGQRQTKHNTENYKDQQRGPRQKSAKRFIGDRGKKTINVHNPLSCYIWILRNIRPDSDDNRRLLQPRINVV